MNAATGMKDDVVIGRVRDDFGSVNPVAMMQRRKKKKQRGSMQGEHDDDDQSGNEGDDNQQENENEALRGAMVQALSEEGGASDDPVDGEVLDQKDKASDDSFVWNKHIDTR